MYSYDTPMTQDLLQQITEQLHNVGFMSLQWLAIWVRQTLDYGKL